MLTDHYLKYIMQCELNRRVPNSMHDGVRVAMLIRSQPLLNFEITKEDLVFLKKFIGLNRKL